MQALKQIALQTQCEIRRFGFRSAERNVQIARTKQQESLKPKNVEKKPEKHVDNSRYPRKIFSGIQPTGSVHIGNYLGALKKWVQLQNSRDNVTFCIVDMHALTLPKDPATLRENIFQTAATLLACGIDPDKSTLFVQSSVPEHSELSWILGCLATMARLGHMPQYKEKTRQLKDIPLGLYVYPVLQAADIMLYKSTQVPVGEDQVQHIQLAQYLAKSFNTKFGETFPICEAIIDNKTGARIRSLRDPQRKMSKSDPDKKATINLTDEPEVIVEKVKKAVTDFISDVSYDPILRPGVSNLLAIHSLCCGKTVEALVEDCRNVDTGLYKLQAAEVIVEHLKPLRSKINSQLNRRSELIYLLEAGAIKAREIAKATVQEVKEKTGLGAMMHMPSPVIHQEEVNVIPQAPEKKMEKKPKLLITTMGPRVPTQSMRVEKKMHRPVKMTESLITPFKPQKEEPQSSVQPPPSQVLHNLTQIVPKQHKRIEKKMKSEGAPTSTALVPHTNATDVEVDNTILFKIRAKKH